MESPNRRPFVVTRTHPDRLAAFAAAVAHDINDELTVLLNAVAGLLSATEPGHPLRERLADLERAVGRCAGITGSLLELTRRRGGGGNASLDYFLLSE